MQHQQLWSKIMIAVVDEFAPFIKKYMLQIEKDLLV
jgi:hypothetical protein